MKNIALTVLLISLMTGCEVFDRQDEDISGIDLRFAEYIGMVNNKKNARETSWSNLFKFYQEDGILISEKIGFLDSEGEMTDPEKTFIDVAGIYPVNEDYIILNGTFSYKMNRHGDFENYTSLLVNLKDGSIYNFNGHVPYESSYYYGHEGFQKDSSGSLYYVNLNRAEGGLSLYKLILDSEQIIQEEYINSNQFKGNYFIITPAGDCIFRSDNTLKFKDHTGGIQVFDQLYVNIFKVNGRYFGQRLQGDTAIYELLVNTENPYGIQVSTSPYISQAEAFHIYETDEYCILLSGEEIVIENYYGLVGFVFDEAQADIYNLGIPVEIGINTAWGIDFSIASYLYISTHGANDKAICRLDLSQFNVKPSGDPYYPDMMIAEVSSYHLYDFPANLDIYDYRYLENGELSFIGFNLEDETDISGIINLENEIVYNSIENKYTVEILKKIN